MKKIFIAMLFVICSCQLYAKERGNKIEIFKVSDKPVEFTGYLIKDNQLYVDLGFTDEERSKIFKYEDKKLIEVPMSREEIIDFSKKYYARSVSSNNKNDLGDGKYLILRIKENTYADYYMSIIDSDGKEQDISRNRYTLLLWNTYAYIDKENQKIYMTCRDEKNKKMGLYVYDVKKDIFIEEYVDSEKKYYEAIRYFNPIRIPNTPYLMLAGFEDEKNWGLYIQEIPEWKAEQVKYVIDGPANLRDKPKGKVIGNIENDVEVKMINKKGDWYEVESGNLKGWTFKDNIKEVK